MWRILGDRVLLERDAGLSIEFPPNWFTLRTMNAVVSKKVCHEKPRTQTVPASAAPQSAVIPLMSKEEGERLISQMPQRSLKEALEMMQTVLGREMPLIEGATRK